MEILVWSMIVFSFIIAFIGLIYPIVPSVFFIIIGFLLYGCFMGFHSLTLGFWIIQCMLAVLLFLTDYMTNYLSIKKFGGSKAAIWGSIIGLLIGPFAIPVVGFIIGPFVGAILFEWLIKKPSFKEAVMAGIGAWIGLLSSVFVKFFIELTMIGYFLLKVL